MTSYSTNEYHRAYRNISLSKDGKIYIVSHDGTISELASNAKGEIKAFDKLADGKTKHNSMINFKSSMSASFEMNATVYSPYFRKLFWRYYISDNKSMIQKYMKDNNHRFANDEPMLFMLSHWIERKIVYPYFLISIFSTEYKIYRYIVKYFLDT